VSPAAGADELQQLREAHIFDPAPRHDELHELHVPFDSLTGTPRCERTLDAALRRGERVALVGASGAGKSSVIEWTLGPLVEHLAPLPIPVALEDPEVAINPVEFAGHLVRTVARYVSYALPAYDEEAREMVEHTTPTMPARRRRGRLSRITVAPGWMGAKVELTAELASTSEPPAPTRTGAEVIEQAQRILELIAAHDLLPVLVFDDTDKWLLVDAVPEAAGFVTAFFGRVVRLLADELPAAAVLAVHEHYLELPGYRAAAGFLETTIHVPPLPDAGALGRILAHRIGLVTELPAEQFVAPEAVDALFRHYIRGGRRDLRRRVLYVAHTALARACDDAAAAIAPRHVDIAVSECEPW
jgi:energy-coupling factor transporter ATP-binding protein EcfA2